MRSLLFTRILTAYSIIVLALFIAFFVFSNRAVRRYHLDAVGKSLADADAIVNHEILPYVTNAGARKDLQAYVLHVGKLTQKRITVVAPDGRVIADSEGDPATMDNHSGRLEIAEALRGRPGSSLRLSDTLKEPMLYVATPVMLDGKPVAAVRSSVPMNTLDAFLSSLRGTMLVIALIAAVLALASVFAVSRKWSRPIELLAQAARDVAAGKLDTKVYVDTRDETAALSLSFNDMVARVRGLLADQARRTDELNTIIASLDEGLVVIRADGSVILCNDRFTVLTGIPVRLKASYWESIRTPVVMEVAERALAERRHVQRELDINDRHLVCSGTFVETAGTAVITLHDVTDIMAMVKMKKEFVSNVSHELRTPLTSIKGYAETLLDGATPEARKYLEIVVRNTERLIAIVEDLLHLSELERDGCRLDLDTVDAGVVVANAAKSLEKRFAEKGLALVLNIPHGLTLVSADPFRIEQVVVNLLDNALKYTESGRVTVTVGSGSGEVTVTVEDTGSGIPARDLPHIFERFYVVDKSRARKLGGTGLGLAIAKHIVLLHNGKIEARSDEGKGSAFTVSLPVAARRVDTTRNN